MTDTLIDRLRQYRGEAYETTECYNGARDEAANEIERLRREVRRLTDRPALIHRFVAAFLALSGFGFWGLMVEAVVSAGVVPWRIVVLAAAACIAALIWIGPDLLRIRAMRR